MTQFRLADILRIYAATANLEQKQLAKVWGCSEATVSRFLNRKAAPDMATTSNIIRWILAPYPNFEIAITEGAYNAKESPCGASQDDPATQKVGQSTKDQR